MIPRRWHPVRIGSGTDDRQFGTVVGFYRPCRGFQSDRGTDLTMRTPFRDNKKPPP